MTTEQPERIQDIQRGEAAAMTQELTQQIEAAMGVVREQSEQVHQHAEAILAVLAEEDREPSVDEVIFFRTALSWDDAAIKSHRRRKGNELRLRRVAATRADRAKLAERADESQKALDREGPGLREEIAKLTAKLNDLEASAKRSTARLEEANRAAEQLREYLPPHLAEQYQQAMRAKVKPIKREYLDLNTQVQHLKNMLGGPDGFISGTHYWEAVKREDRRAVELVNSRLRPTSHFTELKQRWRKSLELVEPARDRMEQAYREALAEVESVIDPWVG